MITNHHYYQKTTVKTYKYSKPMSKIKERRVSRDAVIGIIVATSFLTLIAILGIVLSKMA